MSSLKETIATYLASRRGHVATGSLPGEESVSGLIAHLRQTAGWNVPTNHDRFERLLESEGFKLRVSVVGRGSARTFVSN